MRESKRERAASELGRMEREGAERVRTSAVVCSSACCLWCSIFLRSPSSGVAEPTEPAALRHFSHCSHAAGWQHSCRSVSHCSEYGLASSTRRAFSS